MISAAVIAMILASLLFVAAEAHHDCCGEDCRICAAIMICDRALRRIGGQPGVVAVLLAAVLLSGLLPSVGRQTASVATPVSEGVRINC